MNNVSFVISIISGVITIGSLLWVVVNWAIIKPIKRHLHNNQVKRYIQLDQERHQQKIQNDQEFCHLVSNMINTNIKICFKRNVLN